MAKSLASVAVEHLERVEAQRDHLDQQVRELLETVSAHQSEASVYCKKCGYFGPDESAGAHPDCDYLAGLNSRDFDLYATAQRIREERGE